MNMEEITNTMRQERWDNRVSRLQKYVRNTSRNISWLSLTLNYQKVFNYIFTSIKKEEDALC